MTGFGATGINRCLGLNVVFREEDNTATLQILYHPEDRHFILFHVEFKDGLSILVLKNKATRYKNLPLEIEKSLKKSNVLNGRSPAVFHTLPY
jgi:hypothetical protein